jgi:pSer/pThr/pTyr-binding forkhead associated (FHA) protein
MSALRLVVIEGMDVGREFEIAGVLTVGRDHSVGLVLEDQEVSRRHASLAAEGDAVAVEDLGSKNGTYVNGEPISEKHILGVGEKLRIGTTVLQLLPVVAETTPAPVPDREASETRLHVPQNPEEDEASG